MKHIFTVLVHSLPTPTLYYLPYLNPTLTCGLCYPTLTYTQATLPLPNLTLWSVRP
jgi:hypothetical protein